MREKESICIWELATTHSKTIKEDYQREMDQYPVVWVLLNDISGGADGPQ